MEEVMAYIVKVETRVYEDNDDMNDVFEYTVRARASEKTLATAFADKVHATTLAALKAGA
jgi:hypothetical protein